MRGASIEPLPSIQEYETKTQQQVLDEAFEKNRKAFFNAYTPDPNAAKIKQSNRLAKYLNEKKDSDNQRKLDSSASSYIANRNKFFGVNDE